MIASPKNFIEQFQNFIEHIAGVMNGLVSTKKAQTFTDAEKKQARNNIGAASSSDVTNLQTALNGKANSWHTHAIGDITDLQANLDTKMPRNNDRGVLSGYGWVTNQTAAFTIDYNTGDDCYMTAAAQIWVPDSVASCTWTKVVGITNAGATIALGGAWRWSGGETPTVKANSLLVLKWIGSFGFAALQTTTV